MFAPQEPKYCPDRFLAATVVPHYCATASQKALWELGHQRHHKALATVVKTTDQSEPATNCDVSLHLGRQRSKAFQEDLHHRQIGIENKKLIGSLAKIVQQPSNIARFAQQPRPQVPQRGRENERRKQKELTRDNEMLVKRLLNVKTSFNRQGDERDYTRHRRNLERMKKISEPPPCGVRQPRALALPGQKDRPMALPRDARLQALQSSRSSSSTAASEEVRTFACRATRRTLPPLPKNLFGSRSMPALMCVIDGDSSVPPLPAIRSATASFNMWESREGSFADQIQRGSPHSTTSAAASERRQLGPSTSIHSSTCYSSIWPRSPRSMDMETADEDCGFGCDRQAEDVVSPPDTPALARSIVAGSLPPMSPSPSSPATVAESSASSPSSPARRALSRQAAIEDGCSALKSDN